MVGLGTLFNTVGIVAGGVIGLMFGKLLKTRYQETLTMVCGVSVLFIGIAGGMEGMLQIQGSNLTSTRAMFVVVTLGVGGLIGEMINIEASIEHFGEWLKLKSGNAKDTHFINGFLTTTLTVSIGAMAIVGALQDGIHGDWSILGTKTILDFIFVMVMASSLGKGCIFSAIPVFLFEGTLTLMATFVRPFMTATALNNLSLIGSILIFCVGVNLVFGKKVRVANLLPAIIIAIFAAFL